MNNYVKLILNSFLKSGFKQKMNDKKVFSLKIAGAAGQGVKSAGLMFSKLFTRSGFEVYNHTEYPSLIRGGHNTIQINVSKSPIGATTNKIDLLVALNKESLGLHLSELKKDGAVLLDEAYLTDDLLSNNQITFLGLPIVKIIESIKANNLLSNTVALGAVTQILGADLNLLKQLLNEEYGRKGPEIIELNFQAALLGYEYGISHFINKYHKNFPQLNKQQKTMLLNGVDAVFLGAIASDLKFASIYPMSPVSGIMHLLAEAQEKTGLILKQTEDEISAIHMALGASFAGARAMTSTSGGGFCLMSEGLGLAAMTETPIVIINGMRPGPATGLPTWSEQGDLNFILNAHQGDFPRIVLAPGDAKEAYELTKSAFNLADKYQTPVVILMDKNLCENEQSFAFFNLEKQVDRGKLTKILDPEFKRYKNEMDGISTRSIPGVGNFLIANSDEHDETGFSSENLENRNLQMRKRMQKLTTCFENDMEQPILYGQKHADLTIVSWGSNKGGIIKAMENFSNVNYLHLTWMNPFPYKFVKEVLLNSKKTLIFEYNFGGQLKKLIKEQTGIQIEQSVLRYDGRIFTVEEIIEEINLTLKK